MSPTLFPPTPPPPPPPIIIPPPKSIQTTPIYLGLTSPRRQYDWGYHSTIRSEALPLHYHGTKGWYINTLPPNPVPIYLPLHELFDPLPQTFHITHFKSQGIYVFHFDFDEYIEGVCFTIDSFRGTYADSSEDDRKYHLTYFTPPPDTDYKKSTCRLLDQYEEFRDIISARAHLIEDGPKRTHTLCTNNLFVAHFIKNGLTNLVGLRHSGDYLPPIVPTHPHPEFTSEMDFKPIPPSELEVEPKPHSKRQKGKKRTAVSDYENMFKTPRHHRNKRDQTHAHYTQPQPIGTTFVNTALTNDDGEMLLSSSNGEPLIVREPVHHTFTGNLSLDIPSFFALFAGKGYVPSQLATVPKALVVDSILAWTQGYGLKDFHTLSHIVRTHLDGPYVVSRKTPDHSHQIRAIRRFLKVMHIHGDFKELAPYFSDIGYNPPQGTFTSEMWSVLSSRVDDYVSKKTSAISSQAAAEIKESIRAPGFLEEIGSRIGLSATSSIGSVFKNMLTSTLASLTDMGTQISQFVSAHLPVIIFLIIGTLIGLVGSTLVRMAFTVIFPTKLTEFTSEADSTGEDLVNWIGRTITSGLVPTFSKTTPFKALTGTLAIFTFFEKAPKFIEFASNLIKSIIDHTWQFIYNTPYFNSTQQVQLFHKTLENMMAFVDRDYEKIPLSDKEKFCENYEQLQFFQSRSVTFKDKDLFVRLSNVINNRRDLYNTVRANIKIAVTRQEPTSTWITGEAGLGKTETVDRLFEYVYSLIIKNGRDSPDPVQARAFSDLPDDYWDRSHIGLHSHQDAFFSNYAKNWAFLLDDWRQFGDDEAINSETQIFMLGKATGRFPLPMAELKDKGNNFFVSKMIGVTTNMNETNLTVPVGYTSYEAFNRRRDFVIHLGGKTNDAAYGTIQQYAHTTFSVKRWNHSTKQHEAVKVGNGMHGFRKLGKLIYERYLYYTEKYMKNSQDFDFGSSSSSSSDPDDNNPPPPPDYDFTLPPDIKSSPAVSLNRIPFLDLTQEYVNKVFDAYYMRMLPLIKLEPQFLESSPSQQTRIIKNFHENIRHSKTTYLEQRASVPDTTASTAPTTITTSILIEDKSEEEIYIPPPGMCGSFSGKTTLQPDAYSNEQHRMARRARDVILERESLKEIPADIINFVTTSMGYPPVVDFTSEMDVVPTIIEDTFDDGYDSAPDYDDFNLDNDPETVQQTTLQDVAEQAWYCVLTSPVTGPPLRRRLHRWVTLHEPGRAQDIPYVTSTSPLHGLRSIPRQTNDGNNFNLLFCSYNNTREVGTNSLPPTPQPPVITRYLGLLPLKPM
jgi:hypothetical protein